MDNSAIVKVSRQSTQNVEADAIFGEASPLRRQLFSNEVNQLASEYGWEGLVEQFWNLRRRNDDFRWGACEVVARLVCAARDQLENNPGIDNKKKRFQFGHVWRVLAKELGVTTVWVRNMVRVWLTFHEVETREENLSFTHHVYASGAETPKDALALALGRGWSAQKLMYSMQTSKDEPVDEKEELDVYYDRFLKMLRGASYPALIFRGFFDSLKESHMQENFEKWWEDNAKNESSI